MGDIVCPRMEREIDGRGPLMQTAKSWGVGGREGRRTSASTFYSVLHCSNVVQRGWGGEGEDDPPNSLYPSQKERERYLHGGRVLPAPPLLNKGEHVGMSILPHSLREGRGGEGEGAAPPYP
eukprot:c23784_g1_i4 orf=68-433(-)